MTGVQTCALPISGIRRVPEVRSLCRGLHTRAMHHQPSSAASSTPLAAKAAPSRGEQRRDAAAARSGMPDPGFPPVLEEEVRSGSCQRPKEVTKPSSIAVAGAGRRHAGISLRSVSKDFRCSDRQEVAKYVTGGDQHTEGGLEPWPSQEGAPTNTAPAGRPPQGDRKSVV